MTTAAPLANRLELNQTSGSFSRKFGKSIFKPVLVLALVVISFFSFSPLALADYTVADSGQVNCPPDEIGCNNNTNLPTVNLDSNSVQTIFQLVFGIIGAIAVLIIVIAGLRLVISSGDPETVNKARQTIIFSAVGLAIAISAEVIVIFVLNKL